MYWYQQALGQGPQFLIQYYNREVSEKGNISDRFSGESISDLCSELNLSSLELTDSALYLCASSQDKALHDQVPLGQKCSCPSSGSGSEYVDCQPGKPSLWWNRQSSPDVHFLIYEHFLIVLTKIMQGTYYFNCYTSE